MSDLQAALSELRCQVLFRLAKRMRKPQPVQYVRLLTSSMADRDIVRLFKATKLSFFNRLFRISK